MPKKNGEILKCANCGNEKYFALHRIERSENLFCCFTCANEYQSRNKVKLECKTCHQPFSVSTSSLKKAHTRGHEVQHCSIACRNNDTARMTEKAQSMNKVQLEKNGLNKLELFGREWLQTLGFRLNEDFFEQVLLFDKFTVDIFMPRERLIIQFDGDYWHSKPKRKQLDISQDAYLRAAGYKVFRISDSTFKSNSVDDYKNCMSGFINSLIGINTNNISWQKTK
jgi:very-short-patch-repair endonuclease